MEETERRCVECGGPIGQFGGRSYCSSLCRSRAQRGHRTASLCQRCGLVPKLEGRGQRYCADCRRAVDAEQERNARRRAQAREVGRPSAAARGYGAAHKELREQWAPRVAEGLVDCARCGERIAAGEPWDLGHDDHDRTVYRGPEHRACNRATAGRKPAPTASRVW